MNEIEFKKGIKEIKNIKLDDKEKDQMLRAVFNAPIASPYAPKISFWMSFSSRKMRIAYTGLLILIMIVSGGAITYGTETSLPGDILYSVKVNIGEPIRDLLSTSPEQKAEWESVKAVRRLDEAADLAAKGQLTEQTRTDLENRFIKHADAFDSSVSEAATSSPQTDLVKMEFEANVTARVKIFSGLSDKNVPVQNPEESQTSNNQETKASQSVQTVQTVQEARIQSNDNSNDNNGNMEIKKLENTVRSKMIEIKNKENSRTEQENNSKNANGHKN